MDLQIYYAIFSSMLLEKHMADIQLNLNRHI